MYIIQIRKIYKNKELISKECRLLEYESLSRIHDSIINDKREVYRDKYLIGNLCSIIPNIIGMEIKEDELFYVLELWDKSIMINQFIKL